MATTGGARLPTPAPPSSTWAWPGIVRPWCPPGTRQSLADCRVGSLWRQWWFQVRNTKFKLEGDLGARPPRSLG